MKSSNRALCRVVGLVLQLLVLLLASCQQTPLAPLSRCSEGRIVFTDCGATTYISISSPNSGISNRFQFGHRNSLGIPTDFQPADNVIATDFVPTNLRRYGGSKFYFNYRDPLPGDSTSISFCTANIIDVKREYGELKRVTITEFSIDQCP